MDHYDDDLNAGENPAAENSVSESNSLLVEGQGLAIGQGQRHSVAPESPMPKRQELIDEPEDSEEDNDELLKHLEQ